MRPRFWKQIPCFGLTVLSFVGCGNSDPSETTVVTPPSPTTASDPGSGSDAVSNNAGDATATTIEPPGAIELPPGEIPAPESGPAQDEQGIEMPAGVEVSDPASANATPQIRYGTWEEIQLAARSSGRVTVVDLWSLSCEPCLREFPGLVETHRQLGSQVQCIAVDMDYDGRKTKPPETYETRVTEFLSGVGAVGFPTYISRTPSEDVFVSMDINSLPAVVIYDAQGEVVEVFSDSGDTIGFTYERDIMPALGKLTAPRDR